MRKLITTTAGAALAATLLGGAPAQAHQPGWYEGTVTLSEYKEVRRDMPKNKVEHKLWRAHGPILDRGVKPSGRKFITVGYLGKGKLLSAGVEYVRKGGRWRVREATGILKPTYDA